MEDLDKIAEADVQRLVEYLDIRKLKLEKLETEKDELIKLIKEGNVIIDDEGKPIYKLMYPISKGDGMIEDIPIIKGRIRTEDVEKNSFGKNQVEQTRRMYAFLSGQNSGVFSMMDTDDLNQFGTLAAFFLPK